METVLVNKLDVAQLELVRSSRAAVERDTETEMPLGVEYNGTDIRNILRRCQVISRCMLILAHIHIFSFVVASTTRTECLMFTPRSRDSIQLSGDEHEHAHTVCTPSLFKISRSAVAAPGDIEVVQHPCVAWTPLSQSPRTTFSAICCDLTR